MSQVTPSREQFFGKFRGVVADIDDPWSKGRIRAMVPQALGDEASGWALPCVPYAGDHVGMYAVPPVGAGVWIEFEGGNLDFPVWVGCWWGDNELPQDHEGRGATPKQKVFRSEEGLHVQLDDQRGVVTVCDGDGRNRMEIRVGDGTVRIEADQNVIINAPTIELVDGARHPVALGDDLLNYLNQLVSLYNAHLHPGETIAGVIPVAPAPPVAPFPPATPALLSQRVTTG